MKKYIQHIAKHLDSGAIIAISGSLAGAVFSANLSYWALLFVLAPIIKTVLRDERIKKKVCKIALFFVPFYALVLFWFLDTDLSAINGVSGTFAQTMSVVSWIIMVSVLTLVTIILFVFLLIVQKKLFLTQNQTLFVALPATFVLAEYARSYAFGSFLYGPGATLGDNWNFGSFGLAAIETPLATLSQVIGMYGLTYITVVGAVVSYLYIYEKKSFPMMIFVSMVISVIAINTFALNRPTTGQDAEISVLGLKFGTTELHKENLIVTKRDTKKDLIVLPEYSGMYASSDRDLAYSYIHNRLNDNGVSIDVDEGNTGEWYGTIEFRDKNGDIVGSHTKEFLIPTGEYLPYILRWSFALTGNSQLTEEFDETRKLQKGEKPQVFESESLSIGPIACSGILSREAYRTLVYSGAEILTNSASLTIFDGSKAYFGQSLMMAKFHAVANNRPFVQASRAAPVFAINPDGSYALKPQGLTSGFSDAVVTTSKARTIYTFMGEWVLFICFSLFLVAAYLIAKKEYTRKRKGKTHEKKKSHK